jgi:hypothetical protein
MAVQPLCHSLAAYLKRFNTLSADFGHSWQPCLELVVCYQNQVYDGTAICDERMVIDKLTWTGKIPPMEIIYEIKTVITKTLASYDEFEILG